MPSQFESCRQRASSFLQDCRKGECDYALTPRAEPTGYARCFAVFLMTLLKIPPENKTKLAETLVNEMTECRKRASREALDGKPYRQLLAFTLSALAALGEIKRDALADFVAEQIPEDVGAALQQLGCLEGKAGSGNQAMFLAVFLLHARDVLGLDTQKQIDMWTELHLRHMNAHGFWGHERGMTHLQFQNGYHQYEIFEYLGIANPRQKATITAVLSLADAKGHFAPYPGGGGCYDYDAVFVLTPEGQSPEGETRAALEKTAASIVAEQNPDGGFAESLYVRPRSLSNLCRFASHVWSAGRNCPLFMERLRYALTLQRPVHNRIHTHWSRYSRHWGESGLWDTWFRLLTLARIEAALDPSKAGDWGFIPYPGIGFHPSARRAKDNGP